MYVLTPKCGSPIYHLLLADCTKQALAGAFIQRRQTINWILTQTKLSSIYRQNPVVT